MRTNHGKHGKYTERDADHRTQPIHRITSDTLSVSFRAFGGSESSFPHSRYRLHHEQFIAPVVDHFHGDLLAVAWLEGRADGAGQVVPDGIVVDPLQGPLEVVPGRGPREEGLADVEAEVVVIG